MTRSREFSLQEIESQYMDGVNAVGIQCIVPLGIDGVKDFFFFFKEYKQIYVFAGNVMGVLGQTS